MKTLSPKTSSVINQLRTSVEALRLIYGEDTPLITRINAAISRLSLLDCGLQGLASDVEREPQNVKDVATLYLERL